MLDRIVVFLFATELAAGVALAAGAGTPGNPNSPLINGVRHLGSLLFLEDLCGETVPDPFFQPPADASDDWKVLFAEQRWYASQKSPETIFRGKLEAVPNADAPSTLQRAAYYRLGDRTIYTAAKRVSALDRLAGKQVEIRGKSVDFRLEGQAVREIWPAAVRVAAREDDPPKVIQEIRVALTRRERRGGFRGSKPVVIEAAEKLGEVFNKEVAEEISKQVDLEDHVLVLFQWAGSGQDKLTYQVESRENQSSVMFSYQPGRTRDLRPHSHLFAIRRGTKWSVAE